MKRYVLTLLTAAICFCPQVFSQTVIDTITVGQGPTGVVVNSKNNRLYVANGLDHTVSVIDGVTDQIIGTMITSNTPTDIAINAVKNEVWVCESDAGTNVFAEVFDGNTFALLKSIPAGTGVGRIAVHPHLNRVYVANDFSGFLTVIDGSQKKVLTNVNLACSPFGVAVNTATQRVYVGTEACAAGSVYVIDATTNTLLTTIATTGVSMNYAAVDQNHNRLYLTDDINGFYAIDGNTNTVIGLVTGLNKAHGVAAVPSTQKAVEADSGSNKIKIINGNIPGIGGSKAVGRKPVAVAVNGVTRRIYVVNQTDNTVTVMSY
jgi:YVTN family beta-propeller protein